VASYCIRTTSLVLLLGLALQNPVRSARAGPGEVVATGVAAATSHHVLDWSVIQTHRETTATRPTRLFGTLASPDLASRIQLAQPLFSLERAPAAPARAVAAHQPTTCRVTNPNDAGPNTLRSCLAAAADGDTVVFDPAVFPPTAPQTIALEAALPAVDQDNLTIDASNAGVILEYPGAERRLGGIIVDGARGVAILGLHVRGFLVGIAIFEGTRDCVIGGDSGIGNGPTGQGNVISDNGHGIQIAGPNTSGIQIIGNYLGVGPEGVDTGGNINTAVLVANGASGNTIGGERRNGTCEGPCNVIGGNGTGVVIQGEGTNRNRIIGNFIGTTLSGNTVVRNRAGVTVGWGASHNVVGGAHTPGVCDGPCNLISGNDAGFIGVGANSPSEPVEPPSRGNRIVGNFVGTDAAGNSAVPNVRGIEIKQQASDFEVGGTADGEGNLVSGNDEAGVMFLNPGTTNNRAIGNVIGLDATGTRALPNYNGVHVDVATGNRIGGAGKGEGNVVSGNEYIGVHISHYSAPGNVVQGNTIGTDAEGQYAIPNRAGVVLTGASGNTVGGSAPGEGNLISGNLVVGLALELESHENRVLGNRIGTDRAGLRALPNHEGGMAVIFGASNNAIGGSGGGDGNLISGNLEAGIKFEGADTKANRVEGNRIGTTSDGGSSLPNAGSGIVVVTAPETTIGGSHESWVCEGPCNLISGNALAGIVVQGRLADPANMAGSHRELYSTGQAMSIRIVGNFIGTDATGTTALPNASGGIEVHTEAVGVTIGGSLPGEGNVISGNLEQGVHLQEEGTRRHHVAGNRIGTTADGRSALPNAIAGVHIGSGATDITVGGDTAAEGNLISGHGGDSVGVVITSETPAQTRSHLIANNRIGTDRDGTAAIPNGFGIAFLNAADNTVRNNVVSGNRWSGISVQHPRSTGNTFTGNTIGVALDRHSPLGNHDAGVQFMESHHNTLGPGNVIAHNRDQGVYIWDESCIGNKITQNSIYANRGGQISYSSAIDIPLVPDPLLRAWDGETLSGAACPACIVELFLGTTDEPSGEIYATTTTARSDGSFSTGLDLGSLSLADRYLSATATDSEGSTSRFAKPLLLHDAFFTYLPTALSRFDLLSAPAPSPTATLRPTPTNTPVPWPTPARKAGA